MRLTPLSVHRANLTLRQRPPRRWNVLFIRAAALLYCLGFYAFVVYWFIPRR